ncbi:MAG: hypothetical protein AAB152_08775 [Candidatus Coatesbacteria bacterium]
MESDQGNEVQETYGLQPLVWGGYLLVLAVVSLLTQKPDSFVLGASATALACSALTLWYEHRRRGRALSMIVSADTVEIHLQGQFSHKVPRGEVTHYALQITNSIQYMMVHLMCDATAVVLAVVFWKSDLTGKILGPLGAIAMLVSTGSTVYTRFFCTHLFVPKKDKGSWGIMVAKSQGKLLVG